MKIKITKPRRSAYIIATSDIAFLLLIFLVVTSSLEYSQEIVPPSIEYTSLLDQGKNSVVLEISADGRYSILGYTFSLSEISETLASLGNDVIIKIYADKKTKFNVISNVLAALRENQKYKVFFILPTPEE